MDRQSPRSWQLFRRIILEKAVNSGRLIGLVLSLAAMVPGGAAAWTGKDIRDWSVDCTNGLTCNMSYYDWSAKGIQLVGFLRRGGADAPVALKLRMGEGFGPEDAPDATYSFVVDGRQILVISARQLKPEARGNAFLLADAIQARALMAAMEKGTVMEAKASTPKRAASFPVKLSGVKGAMLFIDEAQGRLGRTDALAEKGDKLPPKDEVAGDIETLEDMPAIVRRDFTESGGACGDLEPASIGQFQGFDIMVGSTRLIAVPCGTGGAYNQPYALYVGYDVIVERIAFPLMDEGSPTTMSTAFNIDFDPVTRVLTAFDKGRGLGDCGQFYKWRFNEDAATLSLLEERAKDECDGEGDGGGPDTFPVVWQVKK